MQEALPHWNSLGPQEDGAQPTSSLPSPHSSSPLHTKLREMQRPLAHVNSLGAHVMLPGGRGGGHLVKRCWGQEARPSPVIIPLGDVIQDWEPQRISSFAFIVQEKMYDTRSN